MIILNPIYSYMLKRKTLSSRSVFIWLVCRIENWEIDCQKSESSEEFVIIYTQL